MAGLWPHGCHLVHSGTKVICSNITRLRAPQAFAGKVGGRRAVTSLRDRSGEEGESGPGSSGDAAGAEVQPPLGGGEGGEGPEAPFHVHRDA